MYCWLQARVDTDITSHVLSCDAFVVKPATLEWPLHSLILWIIVSGALEEGREGKLKDDLSEKSRHQLKHRELFLSRQVETLPATHIRGKCAVTLLNETESLQSYLNKEVGVIFSKCHLVQTQLEIL